MRGRLLELQESVAIDSRPPATLHRRNPPLRILHELSKPNIVPLIIPLALQVTLPHIKIDRFVEQDQPAVFAGAQGPATYRNNKVFVGFLN